MQFFSLLWRLGTDGNVEDLGSQKNPGKFLVLLAMLAEIDSVLHNIYTTSLGMQPTYHPGRIMKSMS